MVCGKISVIIPVYRTEKYIEKCICSVLSQTYENIEVILVDDGSDDKSGDICDAFSKKDSRIKVIHKENGGLSSARNAGLKVAEGEYTAFVDSDDFIAPDMYRSLVENISSSDISMCAYYSVKGEKLKENKAYDSVTVLSGKQALLELFKDEKIKNHVWNKLFRKELFDGIEFPEGRTFEDIMTTYKLFEKCEKVTYVPYAGYFYVDRDGAISKSGTAGTCFSRYTAHRIRYEDVRRRIPESEGVLLRQLFIAARAFMLCATDEDVTEIATVKKFFTENAEHMLCVSPLGFFEKIQIKAIAGGNIKKLKRTELFRKAEKLLKRIFERKR